MGSAGSSSGSWFRFYRTQEMNESRGIPIKPRSSSQDMNPSLSCH
jgi:hypothetical protein